VESYGEKSLKKIVIDARESGTSTGRYIDKLIEYLYKLGPPFEIILLAKPHRVDQLKKIAPGFEIIEAPYKEFTFSEQLGFTRKLRSLKADLVHFGMVHQPILYRGRVVTSIHDLTTTRFRNPTKNWLVFTIKQLVYKRVIKIAAGKSAAIITPSQFVKDDVVDFTGVSPGKIIVTYEAADEFKEKPEPIKSFMGKDFIMFNGRPLPHKNLRRLIEAFAQLHQKYPNLHLMIAGKKDASHDSYLRLAKQLGVDKQVELTGWITDGQLKWAMQHTRAYIYPSLSEGFGLPPLEAMLNGAPVVASSATCMPEILGDAAHYFDPTDVQNMVDTINEVLTDKALRKYLIEKGFKQAKKYSWQRMAEQTLEVYRQALSE
jgi:glycosyltransferase involved in cell wall biosynthesis